MKTLHFTYKMHLNFDSPVEKHRFTLKCCPQSNRRQRILELNMDVCPKEFLARDRDSFGNICVYGHAEGQHSAFSVEVEGMANTGLSHYETAADEHKLGMYRYTTGYTKPGEALKAYASGFDLPEGMGNYAKAVVLMESLYRDFSYVQGVTDINTTAEEALKLGKGVCQDYSHILIALCHMFRIPARYVVGMLCGEGLSHAWVEVCDSGFWIGLDPTNNLVVGEQHIKISSGRDYGDCRINQGVFTGFAGQSQEISVIVEEIKGKGSI